MIAATSIGAAVGEAIPDIATRLRPDVRRSLEAAAEGEPEGRGRRVLRRLLENDDIAREERVALCQDTGTVWVLVEVGADECVEGDVQAAVDAAVAEAYREHPLRMSVVAEPLGARDNTGDNTPAFVEIAQRSGTGATVHVMLKGGGSDNASRLAMLEPAAGEEGVERFVVDTVLANAASACPPLVVGIGVGATFDKVAGLSKRALLREVGAEAPSPAAARLEARILEAVNASGIGPAGLGGRATALAVHVLVAPCHIAALPVAVNLGCSAMRSATIELA